MRRHCRRVHRWAFRVQVVSEFDAVSGCEGLGRGSDAGNAVDAISAQQASVVDDEQHDVAIAGSS